MKAIGIKMVDLQPMTAREANDKGHKIGEHSFETEGYEVTYPDGYRSLLKKRLLMLFGLDLVLCFNGLNLVLIKNK